jgi:hypothetical protein
MTGEMKCPIGYTFALRIRFHLRKSLDNPLSFEPWNSLAHHLQNQVSYTLTLQISLINPLGGNGGRFRLTWRLAWQPWVAWRRGVAQHCSAKIRHARFISRV